MAGRPARKRMYRTMQGRMVDIEKLRAANESVRAVGNMNVNARGDVLGQGGQIMNSKAEVIQKYYEQPRGMVDDTPTRARPTPPRRTPPVSKPALQQIDLSAPAIKPAPEQVKDSKPVETFKPKTTIPAPITDKKGIDAALDGLE